MTTRIYVIIALGLLSFSTLLQAKVVELETNTNRVATAEYLKGDNGQPPILILHGFLQTRDFPTVSRLATALNEAGHTVLAPTLSLGINWRKKSLACEAIHTHDMDMDTNEVRLWIDWLAGQSGQKIILVGHSSGSQPLMQYMEKYGIEQVKQAVFISLSYFSEGPAAFETAEHAKRAQQAIDRGINPLHRYGLSFCKDYPTTAKAFLSYYHWDRERVSRLASRFADRVHIIIGTGDKRIDKNWREQLKNNNIPITAIDGANHFFDQAHEFDLLDAVETLLEENS